MGSEPPLGGFTPQRAMDALHPMRARTNAMFHCGETSTANVFSPFHIFLEIPAGTIRCYFYLDFVNYAAAEEEEKVQQ